MGRIATIAEIEPLVETSANEWLAGEDFRRLVGDAVEAWARPLKTELNDLTDEVCRRYGIPPGSLNISPELRRVSNPSLNAVESVTSGVIESIVVTLLLAAGAILVLAGPGGWIAGLITALLGASNSAEDIRKMKIWTSVRPTLLNVDACPERNEDQAAEHLRGRAAIGGARGDDAAHQRRAEGRAARPRG